MEDQEDKGLCTDEIKIIEELVVVNGVETVLFRVNDEESQGICVLKAAIDSGVVEKQPIYDFLSQEWLNKEYGKILKKNIDIKAVNDKLGIK